MALLVTWAAWAALPVTLLAVVDDWFLRPRRRAAAGAEARDPHWITVLYHAVPVLLFAAQRLIAALAGWLAVRNGAVREIECLIDHGHGATSARRTSSRMVPPRRRRKPGSTRAASTGFCLRTSSSSASSVAARS